MLLVLIQFYRWLWQVKHQILVTVFGYSSHCKHSPTCSEFWTEQVKLHGTIDGSWRGLTRLLTCW
jgi:putative component of membrane protein insertase Oxa1/YidC/SpoIIIJ protein YidD